MVDPNQTSDTNFKYLAKIIMTLCMVWLLGNINQNIKETNTKLDRFIEILEQDK